MKQFLPFLFIILSSAPLSAQSHTNHESTNLIARLVQASNNVRSVVQLLPEVELLWPQQPRAYFETVDQAVRILETETSRLSKNALVNLFTNMVAKPLPKDDDDAAVCVELKYNIVNRCLRFEEFRGNKARWLEIGRFHGEVRSRIIPNYQNRAVLSSVANVTPQQMEALEAEYQKNFAMDHLQQKLGSVDFGLTASFGSLAVRFKYSKTSNTNFISQYVSNARLTEEEADQLRGKSAP